MSRPLEWMKFDPVRVGLETDGMTFEEVGAYFTLVRHLWQRGPMTADEVRRVLRGCFDGVRGTLVSEGDGLSMSWLEDARANGKQRTDAASKAGTASALARTSKPKKRERRLNERSTTVEQPLNERSTGVLSMSMSSSPSSSESTQGGKERAGAGPDERITRIIDHLKAANEGAIDGTVQDNRRACHTLLQRMAKAYPERDPEEVVRHLIDHGKRDAFHGPNITSLRYLVSHGQKIINNVKAARNGNHQHQSPEDKREAGRMALAEIQAQRARDSARGHGHTVVDGTGQG